MAAPNRFVNAGPSEPFLQQLKLNDYQSNYSNLLYRLQWKSVSRMCFNRRCCLTYKHIYSVRHFPDEWIQMCVDVSHHSNELPNGRIGTTPNFTLLSICLCCDRLDAHVPVVPPIKHPPSDSTGTGVFLCFQSASLQFGCFFNSTELTSGCDV